MCWAPRATLLRILVAYFISAVSAFAASNTSSRFPARRSSRGCRPSNLGWGVVSHCQVYRGSDRSCKTREIPAAGLPSTNCRSGNTGLRLVLVLIATASLRFCHRWSVDRGIPKCRSINVGPATGPAQSSASGNVPSAGAAATVVFFILDDLSFFEIAISCETNSTPMSVRSSSKVTNVR